MSIDPGDAQSLGESPYIQPMIWRQAAFGEITVELAEHILAS